MYLIIITLGVAVVELLIAVRIQKIQRVKLLTNYKYLLAQYKVEQISLLLKNPTKDTLNEISKIIAVEEINGSNKILQDK